MMVPALTSCGVRFCTWEESCSRWPDLCLVLELANATMLAVLDRRPENCFSPWPFCSTSSLFLAMASWDNTASVNCLRGLETHKDMLDIDIYIR